MMGNSFWKNWNQSAAESTATFFLVAVSCTAAAAMVGSWALLGMRSAKNSGSDDNSPSTTQQESIPADEQNRNTRSSPSSPPTNSDSTMIHTLFVWDFDWTVVNCNSDEYIPAQFLGDHATVEGFRDLYHATNGDWHASVEGMVNQALQKQKASPHQLEDAARRMPYLIPVQKALCAIDQKRPQTAQMILSDGNTLFLKAFLEHNLPNVYFHHVVSNEGLWEEDIINQPDNQNQTNNDSTQKRLRVIHQSQQYGGHNCSQCSANLCKTQALEATLKQWFQNDHDDDNAITTTTTTTTTSSTTPRYYHPNVRIVYIGDGANDACPILNVLQKGDIVLARVGTKRPHANQRAGPETDEDATIVRAGDSTNANGSPFGLVPALQKAQHQDNNNNNIPPYQCQVWEWRTGQELERFVRQLLHNVDEK